jgi:chemotaxis protein MotB
VYSEKSGIQTLGFIAGSEQWRIKQMHNIKAAKDLFELQRKHYKVTAVLLVLSIALLTGCVSKGKYEQLEAQYQQTAAERDQLTQDVAQLNQQIEELEAKSAQLNAELNETSDVLETKKSELAETMTRLQNAHKELDITSSQLQTTKSSLSKTAEVLEAKDAALKAKEEELRKAAEYMQRTNQLYDQLVGELKDELAANQVKVQELKDGINVNLSEEILFPSGSAKLNDSGVKVIQRVSEKLVGKQYQIIVAGFTDNIPIRGNLAKKYPTNWELAGARAASVVRVLENGGLDTTKLVATSYGDNFPVATNETPEGRAQNRRIEIRLRPAQ